MRVLFLGRSICARASPGYCEAARILRDEPVEFWMVGPVEIARTAQSRRRASEMVWAGDTKQAAEKYRAADVFILPTLSDGFAITQLEAQAYGLPVISSKFCGDVVKNGRNGIILEEPSAACIAAAIRDCIANPNRLQTVCCRLTSARMNSQSMRLANGCKSLAPRFSDAVKSLTPFSFTFVFYTVRFAFVHGHE